MMWLKLGAGGRDVERTGVDGKRIRVEGAGRGMDVREGRRVLGGQEYICKAAYERQVSRTNNMSAKHSA
jgi:hypothetical protein